MSRPFPLSYGKYILLKPLAQGGMGQICLAVAGEVDGFEKLCVIKRVRQGQRNDSTVRRFLDEGKVVVKLSHGNLVHVFDVGFVNNEVYIAMEYVEGRDLHEVLVRCNQVSREIPLEVALYTVMQICRGLHHAHSYGDLRLVHRDVCPSNILVAYEGEVKVTDFGLAQSSIKEEHTQPGKVFGRLGYLAPEQAREEEADPRTDIYATGIVLWELLTGRALRPQVSRGDLPTALELIRTGAVLPPSRLSPRVQRELDTVVLKALRPKRDERYESAEAMRKALAEVLARVNPGFDAGGVAAFMREIYGKEVEAARAERMRLLSDNYSQLRDASIPSVRMPALLAGKSGERAQTPPATNADLTGQVLDGRYHVVRLLGEGGMGAVFEAEHMEIGRRVAVKILHAVFTSHPETIARFRQEARAASHIGHPNIVEVTDSGTTDDGRLYFVMELLDGVDLAQVMAQERIVPARRALSICQQICKGLHVAHEAGIVHRDLKPENIFLTTRDGRDDFVKILDFGIAKNVALQKAGDPRLTHPGMAMGTPEYMAPEQAAGKDIDRRIDVYATGAMLYEMLTGHLPHEGDNLMQVLSQKASSPPVLPRTYRASIPQGLEAVIMRALAAHPDDRYATMEELGTALAPYALPSAVDWSERSLNSDNAAREGIRSFTDAPTGDLGPAAALALSNDPTLQVSARDGPDDVTTSAPARVVARGEVQVSTDVHSVAQSRLSVGAGPPATKSNRELALGSTHALKAITGSRWLRPLLVIGALLLLGGGAVAAVLLLGGGKSPDQREQLPVDLGPPPQDLPRAAPEPDASVGSAQDAKAAPSHKPLTEEEATQLVEWARRAADGRRYVKPPGDNVRELLERIERDFPAHPGAQKLRLAVLARLKAAAADAVRTRRYPVAETNLHAWEELFPEDEEPARLRAIVEVGKGYVLLGKRRVRGAIKRAESALKYRPDYDRAFELMGDVALQAKQYVQAVSHFEAASGMTQNKWTRRRLAKKIARARKKK